MPQRSGSGSNVSLTALRNSKAALWALLTGYAQPDLLDFRLCCCSVTCPAEMLMPLNKLREAVATQFVR